MNSLNTQINPSPRFMFETSRQNGIKSTNGFLKHQTFNNYEIQIKFYTEVLKKNKSAGCTSSKQSLKN